VTAGTLAKGHMPKEALDDLCALTKIGGHFVTAFRSWYLVKGGEGDAYGYKDKVDELINAGKLELVYSYEFSRGFVKDGVPEAILIEFKDAIDRFQMGKSTLTIFKRLA
jgi:hypothetical protein